MTNVHSVLLYSAVVGFGV